jgi:hypothetical protein
VEREKLRALLVTHLDTLRRNLEVVSIEVLKTKYEKPYKALAKDICTAASEYTRELSLSGIRLKKIYFNDAKTYIDSAIQKTTKLKEISQAAFKRQDIEEIEKLALELRQEILDALHPFFLKHLCLYLSSDCFDIPGKVPDLYNDVTGCIWKDGAWLPFDDTSSGMLFFMREEPVEADIAPISYPAISISGQEEKKAS